MLSKELGFVADVTINSKNSVYRGTAPAGYQQPPPVVVETKASVILRPGWSNHFQ